MNIDPVNFTTQAALFRKNTVELIPPQPGEYTSALLALNDSGTALLYSYDEAFNESRLLYKNGRSTVLDFGPILENDPFPQVTGMNNQGIISGRAWVSPLGYRGFRFDPKTGETILLNPVETDLHTWGLDINTRGDILGYSFYSNGIERIGVWDRETESGNTIPRISSGLHTVWFFRNLLRGRKMITQDLTPEPIYDVG